jgi:hypothetical protein
VGVTAVDINGSVQAKLIIARMIIITITRYENRLSMVPPNSFIPNFYPDNNSIANATDKNK